MIKTELLEIIKNGENSGPYVLRHKQREDVYIRIGSTSQLASREQQLRLLQDGGLVHIEKLPVSGTSMMNLDLRRFEDYLVRVISEPVFEITGDYFKVILKKNRNPSPIFFVKGR